MHDEILDNEEPKKEIRFSFLQNFVLIILWFSVLFGWENFLFFNQKYLIGVVCLLISSVLTFINPKLGLYSTLIMLVLGVMNIAHHMGMTVSMTFGKSGNEFSLDLVYLLLLFVYIGMNRNELSKIFPSKIKNKTQPHRNMEENRFVKKYASKSSEELEAIIKSNQFSKEAIEAAHELLSRRKVKSS